MNSMEASYRSYRQPLASSGLLQEDVIRRIGHALAGLLAVACALEHAADGIDPLHGGDVGELASALVGGDLELQPGDVVGIGAGRIGDRLAGDAAAVAEVPARSGAVIAHHLVGDSQRR